METIDIRWNYIIEYDKVTETFSLHTKKHYINSDITERLTDFFSKVDDLLKARGYPYGITFTRYSAIFAFGKCDGTVISDDINYLKCYEYIESPRRFVDWYLV